MWDEELKELKEREQLMLNDFDDDALRELYFLIKNHGAIRFETMNYHDGDGFRLRHHARVMSKVVHEHVGELRHINDFAIAVRFNQEAGMTDEQSIATIKASLQENGAQPLWNLTGLLWGCKPMGWFY